MIIDIKNIHMIQHKKAASNGLAFLAAFVEDYNGCYQIESEDETEPVIPALIVI